MTPFLRWPGGKRQLLLDLLQYVPLDFECYHEPFLGAGALFFELQRRGRLPGRVLLGDANCDLVNMYVQVRDGVEQVVRLLEKYGRHTGLISYERHRRNFNSRADLSPTVRAALFIYLNRLCFNGLWRVNRAGHFNVPYGHPNDPDVIRVEALRAGSEALACIPIRAADFETALARVQPGDFVYLDPPYVPSSATSCFTAYAEEGWGMDDHRRLAAACKRLDESGVKWLLSNSDTPLVHELWVDHPKEQLTARRSIGANTESRGNVTELAIWNFDR